MEATLFSMEQFLADNVVWLLVVMTWTIVWTGLALWTSARRGSKGWFIVFLLVNTVGLLEIIYLLAVKRKKKLSPDDSFVRRQEKVST